MFFVKWLFYEIAETQSFRMHLLISASPARNCRSIRSLSASADRAANQLCTYNKHTAGLCRKQRLRTSPILFALQNLAGPSRIIRGRYEEKAKCQKLLSQFFNRIYPIAVRP